MEIIKDEKEQRSEGPSEPKLETPLLKEEVKLTYQIVKDNVQCIVQGQHRQVLLKRNDTLVLEKDLSELNLLQCRIWDKDAWVSVIIPKDAAVPFDDDKMMSMLRKHESQATHALNVAASHHILQG